MRRKLNGVIHSSIPKEEATIKEGMDLEDEEEVDFVEGEENNLL